MAMSYFNGAIQKYSSKYICSPKHDLIIINQKRALWYDMVMDSIQRQSQLLLIVTGTAGTGKSHTICAISHALSAKQVLRCATTASAAYLVRGGTIHREFRIPIQQRRFVQLKGVALRDLQEKFSSLELIIVDEFSMLGLNLLGKIDQRLRQAKNRDQPFGDYAQLPPVLATPLFGKAKQNDPFAVQGEQLMQKDNKLLAKMRPMK